ncbi:hypothetical protein ES705_23094 [subsurface metagenome]
MDYINKILCGNDLEILPKLPAGSVNCVTCSPPYWSLRDYGVDPVIWDGNKNCKHEWKSSNTKISGGGYSDKSTLQGFSNKNTKGRQMDRDINNTIDNAFCLKCNAWKGSLGLEPTFELYIKHLCDTFDEVKRVLRKDGTCWVNMGDSYAGGKGQSGARDANSQDERFKKGESLEHGYHQASGGYGKTRPVDGKIGIPAKSLCLIPQRFAIEMVNRGWILRNTIIWYKPNCMPSSANDRFTIDFEYLFFFTKNNRAIFWTNEKTLECVDKKPLGVKGIEGKDWEWRETQDWKEEENAGYEMGATDPHRAASIGGLKLGAKHKKSGKLKKVSLWKGHDYWFEQQFENHLTQESRPDGIVRNRIFNYDSKLNKLRGYKTKEQDKETQGPQYHGKDINYGKQGRNKRTVWTIPTSPYPEAHFAVYPKGLIETPIKAGCPEFVCKKCGKARIKILDYSDKVNAQWGERKSNPQKFRDKREMPQKVIKNVNVKEIGYTDCGCNAGWESGIVLDPFMGAGTSALVALKQRKRFIGIEIKQEYIDMSYKRIARVQQRIF